MKVLLMQPWISYRGAESVSVNQCYMLSQIGHETQMLCAFIDKKRRPINSRKINYLMPSRFISELCYRSRYAMFLFGPIALLILTLRNAARFDVLNPHNLPTVWIAVIAGRLFDKKVIWTAHGVPEEVKWSKKRNIYEYLVWKVGASRIDKFFVQKVDGIVSVSSKVSEAVKVRYKRDSIIVYPGVSILTGNQGDLPDEIRMLRKENDVLLIQVGTLHKQKRQALTIRAISKLNKSKLKAAVIMVGEGSEIENLKILARKLKVSDKVFFAGYVEPKYLGAYYKIADLNIIPSIHESFSATPLEALTFGIISIIPNDSGVLEVIKDFTISTDPHPDKIFDSIREFCKNRGKYRKIALKGQKFILSNMTLEKSTERFEKALNEFYYKEVNPDIYNQKYFNVHHSRPRNQFLVAERRMRLQRALNLLKAKKGMRILDIGCGNGEFAIELSKTGCEVVGIDYSVKAINLANRNLSKLNKKDRKNIRFVHMSAKKIKFDDNSFDAALCLDVFEHIYPEMLRDVVSEIKRVMRPNAKVIVETAPNEWFLAPVSFIAKKLTRKDRFESDEYHINVYNYPRFKSELKKLGKIEKLIVSNDSKRYFSSRLSSSQVSKPVQSLALVYDLLLENPISSKIIFKTPLRIFFGHEFWGVVRI